MEQKNSKKLKMKTDWFGGSGNVSAFFSFT